MRWRKEGTVSNFCTPRNCSLSPLFSVRAAQTEYLFRDIAGQTHPLEITILTKHLVLALEEFSSLGIDFISLNESIDTSSPMGRMVFTVIAAVAELERSIIRERVLAGVDRARRQGKQFGRPIAVVDREKVARLKTEGRSIKGIAKECGIARSTVRSILSRVAKCGPATAELTA